MSVKLREQIIEKELLAVEEATLNETTEYDETEALSTSAIEAEAPVEEASAPVESEKVIERHYFYGSAFAPNAVSPDGVLRKLPKKGIIRNEYGDRIGYLKQGRLYYKTGEYWAHLNKTHRGVIVVERGQETGYVDANNNILSFNNDYIGTIDVQKVSFKVLLITLLLAIAVALTTVIVAHIVSLRAKQEVPTFEFGTTTTTDSQDFVIFDRNLNGEAVLYPGITGSCDFLIKNTSSYSLEYGLSLDELVESYDPTLTDARLPIKYALYKDGVPVIGSSDRYLDIEFFYLSDNILLKPNSTSRFTLLWTWASASDEADVQLANTIKNYTLTINVTAGMVG